MELCGVKSGLANTRLVFLLCTHQRMLGGIVNVVSHLQFHYVASTLLGRNGTAPVTHL